MVVGQVQRLGGVDVGCEDVAAGTVAGGFGGGGGGAVAGAGGVGGVGLGEGRGRKEKEKKKVSSYFFEKKAARPG